MTRNSWIHAAALAAAASGLALGGALLGCGPKPEEMERGATVDNEVTMPTDPNEMKMTEEERRAKAAAQDEAQEQREFNDSDQGDNEPGKP
jgi:hypothetical protein